MPHQTGSADHEGTRPAAAALARSMFSAHYAQTGPTAAVHRLHHMRAACAGESNENTVGCLKKCMTNSWAAMQELSGTILLQIPLHKHNTSLIAYNTNLVAYNTSLIAYA